MSPQGKSSIPVTKPILVDLNLLQKELKDVWRSGWLTNNGYKHQKLENLLSKKIFAGQPTSLVTNATLGLLGALKMFQLKGEVITTPFTFPATPHVISWAGLQPVFCDIDPKTMTIDPEKIERAITSKTSAILGVHVFGQPCAVEAIDRIARKHGLRVIYDAAHAFELEIKRQSIAAYGDASVFSFHATKLFHTGEGGAVVFSERKQKQQFDILKNFGIESENVVDCGLNIKMNELQASLGLSVFSVKNQERKERQRVATIYAKELGGLRGITLPHVDSTVSKQSLQYFVIRISEKDFGSSRDAVLKSLKSKRVYARRYFYPLCTDYPHYRQGRSLWDLPVARKVVKEVLSLPFYGGMTDADVLRVCRAIQYMKR